MGRGEEEEEEEENVHTKINGTCPMYLYGFIREQNE